MENLILGLAGLSIMFLILALDLTVLCIVIQLIRATRKGD